MSSSLVKDVLNSRGGTFKSNKKTSASVFRALANTDAVVQTPEEEISQVILSLAATSIFLDRPISIPSRRTSNAIGERSSDLVQEGEENWTEKDIQQQWLWQLDCCSISRDRSSGLLNGWIIRNRISTWLAKWRGSTTRESSKKCSASSMNGTKSRISDRSRWWSLRLWRRVPEWKIVNVAWRFIIQFHPISKETHLSWHLSFTSTVSSLTKCIFSQSLSRIPVECGEMSKAEVLFDQATTKTVAMHGAMMKGKREVCRDDFTPCFSLLRLCDTQSGSEGDRTVPSNPKAGWCHIHPFLHCLCSVERRRSVEISEGGVVNIIQVIAVQSNSAHVSTGCIDKMRRFSKCSTLLRSINEERFIDVRSDDEG